MHQYAWHCCHVKCIYICMTCDASIVYDGIYIRSGLTASVHGSIFYILIKYTTQLHIKYNTYYYNCEWCVSAMQVCYCHSYICEQSIIATRHMAHTQLCLHIHHSRQPRTIRARAFHIRFWLPTGFVRCNLHFIHSSVISTVACSLCDTQVRVPHMKNENFSDMAMTT